MTKQSPEAEERPRKKKKFMPFLCSLIGTLIILGIIATFLPLTIPHLMGYEIYEVISGSMEPEIPVGSIVYVKAAQPETIEENAVIAYWSADSVVTHRVVNNRFVEGEFVTKGDANEEEDPMPVPYNNLVGEVVYHIPYLGTAMTWVASTTGKVYAAILAACGIMFHMLAGSLRRQE